MVAHGVTICLSHVALIAGQQWHVRNPSFSSLPKLQEACHLFACLVLLHCDFRTDFLDPARSQLATRVAGIVGVCMIITAASFQ